MAEWEVGKLVITVLRSTLRVRDALCPTAGKQKTILRRVENEHPIKPNLAVEVKPAAGGPLIGGLQGRLRAEEFRVNDDSEQLRAMASFLANELGVVTPWHVGRFFPAYRMTDIDLPTMEAIRETVEIGKEGGAMRVLGERRGIRPHGLSKRRRAVDSSVDSRPRPRPCDGRVDQARLWTTDCRCGPPSRRRGRIGDVIRGC